MAKILLVEDDNELRETLRTFLRSEGFDIQAAADGESALDLLALSEFNVIVLDWSLPGLSGIDVLKRYRQNGGQTPVIFLTGKDQIEDKVTGLDGGADDYLTKPFKMRELTARLQSLMRRSRAVEQAAIVFGDLELNVISKCLTRNGQELKLPPREYALLEFLMRRKEQIFSPRDILRHVWPAESQATDETVRTCIKRIRKIIDLPEKAGYIDNIHGHGYRMNRDFLNETSDNSQAD